MSEEKAQQKPLLAFKDWASPGPDLTSIPLWLSLMYTQCLYQFRTNKTQHTDQPDQCQSNMFSQNACGGLTLAGCQHPPKMPYHSPPQPNGGENNIVKGS